MADEISLSETLARSMFIAEFGHTGMTWDSLSDMAHEEWENKACRVLESWWRPDRPYVVLDLAENTLRLSEDDERLVAALRELVRHAPVYGSEGQVPHAFRVAFNNARAALAEFGQQPTGDEHIAPKCTCESFGNGVVRGNGGLLPPAEGCPRHGRDDG